MKLEIGFPLIVLPIKKAKLDFSGPEFIFAKFWELRKNNLAVR